ncbi:hypothetical protein ENASMM143B3_20955 [Enterobacter asburiae]
MLYILNNGTVPSYIEVVESTNVMERNDFVVMGPGLKDILKRFMNDFFAASLRLAAIFNF